MGSIFYLRKDGWPGVWLEGAALVLGKDAGAGIAVAVRPLLFGDAVLAMRKKRKGEGKRHVDRLPMSLYLWRVRLSMATEEQ